MGKGRFPKGYKMTDEEKAEFKKQISKNGTYPTFDEMTPEQRKELYRKRSEKYWAKKEAEQAEQKLGDLARKKRDSGHGARWVGKLDKIALARNGKDSPIKASDSLKAIDTLGRLTGDLTETVKVEATVGVTNWRDFITEESDDEG